VKCTATLTAFALEGVSVRRGDALVLDDVTCQIGSGMATALVGASGAGKSTLLRLLNRLEEPTSGVVRLHGKPLPSLDVLELRRKVGLVGQQPVLLTETVLQDLRVSRPDLTEDHAGSLLERVHLPAEMLTRGTDGLSGGEAQRVCLARTLITGPEVLLLDEPTSAVDAAAARLIEHAVREVAEAGITVLWVTHDSAQVRRIADRVLRVEHGRCGGIEPIPPSQRGLPESVVTGESDVTGEGTR
jgi:UDP-glucose/iron transport system ATP-binding protein